MNKTLGMLGLCHKAGRLVSGDFPVEKAIKEGKTFLVIIADDASDNTKKKFKNRCTYRNVPYLIGLTKEEIGKALGKEIRAVVGIVDENFAVNINKTWR